MGSKRKLATEIVQLLRQRHHSARTLYDVFGGGGAISFEAYKHFPLVRYNEIKTSIVAVVEQLKVGIPEEWWHPVSREQFARSMNGTTAYDGMVQTCWSFGNNPDKGYLYGAEIEGLKLSAHAFIVYNDIDSRDKFCELTGLNVPLFSDEDSFYDRRMIMKRWLEPERFQIQGLEALERPQALERLEQVESIQRIERLPQGNFANIITSNKDYRELAFEPNSIIYCDPPYIGTADYSTQFNHDEFYEWCMAQDNPVYISEYQMPKEFEIVHQFAHKSTLSATNNNKKVIENIFWNGKGDAFKTTLF